MKLAVLMSTYNGEKYLREQIESIVCQKTCFDFDLIVRDDGSSDSTKNILKEYAEHGALTFGEGNNVGAAKAFVYMLRDNPGYDYYAFSDQDDVWYAGKLQKGFDAIKEINGPALYCTNSELVDTDLRSIGRNTHRKKPSYTIESILCRCCCAHGCTSVFNKALAAIIQENDIPACFIMHDSLVTFLCGMIGGEIVYDESPSMKYRMHENNAFGMVTAKQSAIALLKVRVKEITKKKEISAYQQVKSMLYVYDRYIPEYNKKVCQIVIDSEKSMLARLRLLFCKSLKHDTVNMTITKKLEILFGNN